MTAIQTTTRSVFIETREWRDRVHGNTYFSCLIHVNGDVVGVIPMTYGGGDLSFMYHATEWLRKTGWLNAINWRDELQPIRPRDFEHAGIDLYATAYRVNGKREMFKEIR